MSEEGSDQNLDPSQSPGTPYNSADDARSSPEVIVRKSTLNKLIAGLIVAVAFSAFFGGYVVGSGGLMLNSGAEDRNNRSIGGDVPTQSSSSEPTATEAMRILLSLDDDPVRGSANAPVTIVEFSDYQCPFCARFFRETLPEIQSSYIATGKVKFVYRDFPLEQIHPNAMAAAIAAECADEQGKFWEYHDQLFGRQNEWAGLDENFAIERFKDYGARLSLDKMKFDPCLDSEKYLSEVNRDLEDAVKYGSTGTPTFFIGNEREGYVSVRGAQPYSVFQQVIERELSR